MAKKIYLIIVDDSIGDAQYAVFDDIEGARKGFVSAIKGYTRNEFHDIDGRTLEECIKDLDWGYGENYVTHQELELNNLEPLK